MTTSTGTIKYKKTQNTNSSSTFNGKWYGRAVQDRSVSFDEFITHMAEHNSPYSRGVISGVLTDMLQCLQELVLDGKSVRLGELGLVSIGLKTTPADTADAFTPSTNIKSVRLNIRNTKTWSNAELKKLCKFSELSEYSTAESASA
ncbi:MAG: DNA-binding protein [Prevotellaceae bacterium]|nr:DNA-binding protein [Prevotellaceae bacterium]